MSFLRVVLMVVVNANEEIIYMSIVDEMEAHLIVE